MIADTDDPNREMKMIEFGDKKVETGIEISLPNK